MVFVFIIILATNASYAQGIFDQLKKRGREALESVEEAITTEENRVSKKTKYSRSLDIFYKCSKYQIG